MIREKDVNLVKVLAIESSGMTASVAIATEQKVVAEYTVNHKMTHSQTLLPMIDEILKFIGMELEETDALAVSAGPGSFTGLRIGSATAKGIALALKKDIVTVPTLEAMAYNFYGYNGLICPMMDARRNRVYTGLYEFENGALKIIHDQDVDEIEEVLNWINEQGKKAILLGDGVEVYSEEIAKGLDVEYMIAPVHMRHQSASSVAMLGLNMIKEGKLQESQMHKPIYLRPSQAECERERRENEDD